MLPKKATSLFSALSMLLLLQLGCVNGAVTVITAALSLYGGVAVAFPGTAPLGGAALIGQCMGAVVLGIMNNLTQAPAHPDGNFGSLAVVEPIHFMLPGNFVPVIANPTNVDKSVVAAGKLVDDSRMIDLSLKKYYGALAAHSAAAAQMQQSAVCRAIGDMNADLKTYSATLSGISEEIQGTSAAAISFTTADVLSLRDNIVNMGNFPANEAVFFTQANVSPAELTNAVSVIGSIADQDVTAADLQGNVLFSRAAQQISQVDVAVLLPQGFSCAVGPIGSVPTLSTWGAGVMVLLLAAIGLRLVHRNPRIPQGEL